MRVRQSSDADVAVPQPVGKMPPEVLTHVPNFAADPVSVRRLFRGRGDIALTRSYAGSIRGLR